ncbi:hypothetical protein AB0K51_04495 [Kitasatospora sp. NPDC049285]|uniref:hypothetical protein n=1 Tax=Kitasatospora sp. NPDC049285 TaxID=3157096 RepID=UPI0034223F5C
MREEWRECLSRAIDAPRARDTAPRTGVPELREALADHLDLPVADLAVTSGIRGQVAPLVAGAAALVVERPTFLSVPRLAARHVPVLALTWEEILADDGRYPDGSVVWITSPARNPDGRTLTAAEAARLDELADRHRVVVNQAYHWCAPDAPRPVRAHLVGSLHKVAGGGCAVGWQVTPGGRGLDRPGGGGPPTAWQYAWADLITATGLAEPVRTCLLEPAERCRRVAERVRPPAGVELRHGSGPSLSLLLAAGTSEERAHAALAAEGLLTGPGEAFGWDRPALRLSFTGASDADARRCLPALDRSLAGLARS